LRKPKGIWIFHKTLGEESKYLVQSWNIWALCHPQNSWVSYKLPGSVSWYSGQLQSTWVSHTTVGPSFRYMGRP
jgi:hypothetical protein